MSRSGSARAAHCGALFLRPGCILCHGRRGEGCNIVYCYSENLRLIALDIGEDNSISSQDALAVNLEMSGRVPSHTVAQINGQLTGFYLAHQRVRN